MNFNLKNSKFSFFFDGLSENGKRKDYYRCYTIIFVLLSLIVFSYYFFTYKNLLYTGDGWNQHYKALLYYQGYLRNLIKKVFVYHSFGLPEFNFAIGEGADILDTLHYYVIGDPFSILSIIWPKKYLFAYAEIMIMLRLFLSGVVFSELCFYSKKKNNIAVLAGSLMYMFSFWGIYLSARHPYFINPMINLPLLVLGTEKIFRNEKPYLFIFAVAISSLSNFYFFYILVALTVVYVLIRLTISYITEKHNIKSDFYTVPVKRLKDLFAYILNIGIKAIIGTLISGIILLPIISTFLSSSRLNASHHVHLFYPLKYYAEYFGNFISGRDSHYMCMGYGWIAVLILYLLFKKQKNNITLKALFLTGFVFSIFPIFAQIMNGFSYSYNRWSFALSLIMAFILVTVWEDITELQLKDIVVLLFISIAYFFTCFAIEKSSRESVYVQIVFLILFVSVILLSSVINTKLTKEKISYLCLCLYITGIVLNAHFFFSPVHDNYSSKAIGNSAFEKVTYNETLLVAEDACNNNQAGYPKYSGRNMTFNAGMFNHAAGINYYWSISPPLTAKFRYEDMEIAQGLPQQYRGYNLRTALLEISSVEYFTDLINSNEAVPYGYELLNVKTNNKYVNNNYKIYKNKYALPVAYTYNSVFNYDELVNYTAVERQEILLQRAVLSNYDGKVQNSTPALDTENINYKIVNTNGLTISDNKIIVTKAKANLTLEFNGLPDSETYICFKDLNIEPYTTYELYKDDKNIDPNDKFTKEDWRKLSALQKRQIRNSYLFSEPKSIFVIKITENEKSYSFTHYTPEYRYYSGQHSYSVNLGYTEEPVTTITITLPSIGTYSFDSLTVQCQPMTNYSKRVEALKENVLENVEYGEDAFGGTIDLDESRILCITIPFTAGWSATVDGKKAEILKVNDYYMGLDLDEGHHEISLTYKTPLLRAGALMSLMGIGAFAVLVLITEKKRKKI